jgi:hypothetical protein
MKTHRRAALGKTMMAILVILVILVAGGAAAYAYFVYEPGVSSPRGTLWSKTFSFTPGVTIWSADDDGIGPVAFSQNDSVILVGTGQAIGNGSIYAYGENGSMLWTHQLNHFVSSISTSANGSAIAVSGYEIMQGPAGVYEHPALFVFNGQGAEMWNQSYPGQSVSARVSANGSRLGVATDSGFLYMDGSGRVLWSFGFGSAGTLEGWTMSPDGSSVTVSVYHGRANNTTQSVSRSLIVLNASGGVLSNQTTTGTVTNPPPNPGEVTTTTSSSTGGQQCVPATFYNGDGVPSINLVSPDDRYAMVVSNSGNRASMYFVDLLKSGQGCS